VTNKLSTISYSSPIGLIELTGSDEGIESLYFVETVKRSGVITQVLKEGIAQLEEYFEGDRREFTLNLSPKGTAFQQEVWKALLDIPYGRTVSYLDIAKKLGDPNSTRAVGAANGQNPISIIIPCHRVIGNNGHLTGYGGGIEKKKWLLEFEGLPVQTTMF